MSVFQRRLYHAGKPVLKKNGEPQREATWRWEFVWPGQAKPFRGSGYETKRDAEIAEKEARRALRAGKVAEMRAFLGQIEITVGQIIDDYIAARCPNRYQEPRVGDPFDREVGNLNIARGWWGPRDPRTITAGDCDKYFAWRQTTIRKGSGGRTTELELQSLANCFTWAARSGKIPTNPLSDRPKYCDPSKVSHARERMPSSVKEFHAIARQLASDPRSEVCAWAWLLSGLTGLRSEELRMLRAHPTRNGLDAEPGFIDEKFMHVHRCKRGINPRVRLDDPERPHIRPLIEMIRAWRAVRHPQSEWLLPGRDGGQLGETTLTNAVADACKKLKIPRRRAHGARAYYATVRLCQGQSPDDVARELGQGSGAQLIRSTYGVDPDEWQADHWTALAPQYSWVPAEGEPAWAWWTKTPSNIISL